MKLRMSRSKVVSITQWLLYHKFPRKWLWQRRRETVKIGFLSQQAQYILFLFLSLCTGDRSTLPFILLLDFLYSRIRFSWYTPLTSSLNTGSGTNVEWLNYIRMEVSWLSSFSRAPISLVPAWMLLSLSLFLRSVLFFSFSQKNHHSQPVFLHKLHLAAQMKPISSSFLSLLLPVHREPLAFFPAFFSSFYPSIFYAFYKYSR